MAAPKKSDISTATPIGGLDVKSVELKSPEDEQEKALRLHKERLNFYVKEMGGDNRGLLAGQLQAREAAPSRAQWKPFCRA
jgi:hypothetical protein